MPAWDARSSIHGELLGALTADARGPDAFEDIDRRCLTAVAALAAAEMRTTQLIETLERTAERQGLIARDLMRDASLVQGGQIIGASAAISRVRQEIELVARSDFTVLITGETGVGKELVARAIHAGLRTPRPAAHLRELRGAARDRWPSPSCSAIVRGAFTGAGSDRPGKFEVADGGTLFLDEIGELPLVRAAQDPARAAGGRDPAGGRGPGLSRERPAAGRHQPRTSRTRSKAGRFRADLFHRLNVYPLPVPPLRERREDIPLLAGYFCDVARRRLGLGPVRLTAEAPTRSPPTRGPATSGSSTTSSRGRS